MRAALGVIFFVMLLVLYSSASEASGQTCKDCVYSNVASAFCFPADKIAKKEFPSPDGLKKIIVKVKPESAPDIFVEIEGHEFPINFSPWPCPEFEWSQDSKAFFLTYSDGGAVGNYRIIVGYPSGKGVKIIDPSSYVQRDFLAHYPTCFEPEGPNIGGIAWLKDSHHLLIAAEVLPHSNCDMSGTFAAYLIEMPSGKIVKKFGQIEAKQEFGGLLGLELRNSDDECFTSPGACEIPSLHGE